MRKLLAAVLVLGLVALVKVPAFASFASVGISTVAASVSFTAQGVVNISLTLNNLTSGTTTQLWWDPTGITIGSTAWRRADAYVLLQSTITNSTGGIQMYTDNRGAGANPSYTGTGLAAGLVSVSSTTKSLPMCWRVVAVSTTSLSIVESATHLYATELGGAAGAYPCFIWMEDRTDAGFAGNSGDYITIRDSVRGIQHAEATWGTGVGSPVYLYFGANFTNASTPDTFRTTTLRVEAFHD